MKKTIADLLRPSFDYYRSVGELAATLQVLLAHADEYRDPGRWGKSGPWEILVGYSGCTNCLSLAWHSGRHAGLHCQGDLAAWKHVHDSLYDCILESLCSSSPAIDTWRGKHNIDLLRTIIKVPMAYQRNDEEQKAWVQFESLHKHQLKVGTLNPGHRRINLLAAPQLRIDKDRIIITCCVTCKREIRSSPQCYSRWDVCFLLRNTEQWSKPPKWNLRRETFAAFVLRAVDFYKSITHEVPYQGF